MKDEIRKKRGFYEIEGKKLPAVTKVIGDTLAKPQLYYWYGEKGNSEARRISEEAKSFGSAMHKMIADYLRTGQEPMRDAMATEVKQAWEVWYDWWAFADFGGRFNDVYKQGEIEKVIYNDDYAGTCDLFVDGVLLDWKFGGGIYDGYKIQAGAYAKLLNAEKALIVRVAKDEKNIEILEMNKKELEEAAEIFQALLKVFWWQRKKK